MKCMAQSTEIGQWRREKLALLEGGELVLNRWIGVSLWKENTRERMNWESKKKEQQNSDGPKGKRFGFDTEDEKSVVAVKMRMKMRRDGLEAASENEDLCLDGPFHHFHAVYSIQTGQRCKYMHARALACPATSAFKDGAVWETSPQLTKPRFLANLGRKGGPEVGTSSFARAKSACGVSPCNGCLSDSLQIQYPIIDYSNLLSPPMHSNECEFLLKDYSGHEYVLILLAETSTLTRRQSCHTWHHSLVASSLSNFTTHRHYRNIPLRLTISQVESY